MHIEIIMNCSYTHFSFTTNTSAHNGRLGTWVSCYLIRKTALIFSLTLNLIWTPFMSGWWWYLIHQFLIRIIWETITSVAQSQPPHPTPSHRLLSFLSFPVRYHINTDRHCVSLYIGYQCKVMWVDWTRVRLLPQKRRLFVFFLNLSPQVVPQPSWFTSLVMRT